MGNIVLKAYDGDAPYIFISYAHKDADRVLPIISSLQKNGFRVWFDQGIEAGSEWPAFIASRLKGCHRIVAFVSPAFVDSRNCRNEINYALNLNKEMLAIYLEPTELMYGLELQLISSQAMFKFRSPSDEVFLEQLYVARILAECKGDAPAEASAPAEPESAEYSTEEFNSAVRITSDEGKVSAALLQMRLNIGKAKAENIINNMVKKRYICDPDANMTYRVMTVADRMGGAKKAQPTAATASKPIPAPAPRKPSEGLKFFPTDDMKYYKMDGIGACKDLTVVVPDTYDGYPVTEIDLNFNKSYCHAEFKMYIPAGIKIIKNLGTVSNYLIHIEVDPQNPFYASENGALFSKDKKQLIYFKAKKTSSCSVPSGITTILEDSVQCSEPYPFEIKIPQGVERLADRAIRCSHNTNSVKLPSTITSIGGNVFYFGKSITVSYEGTRKQWNAIKKAANWDTDYNNKSVNRIICKDGEIDPNNPQTSGNPYKKKK